MERTYINEAQKAIGSTIKVQGFVENLRNSKYIAFIVLKNITQGLEIPVNSDLSGRSKDILLAGGLLNYTREQAK